MLVRGVCKAPTAPTCETAWECNGCMIGENDVVQCEACNANFLKLIPYCIAEATCIAPTMTADSDNRTCGKSNFIEP
jgi:hypothetical protein